MLAHHEAKTTVSSPSTETMARTSAARAKPDLRMAENFIPGIFVWLKGIVYSVLSSTSSSIMLHFFCFQENPSRAHESSTITSSFSAFFAILPFLLLYYDRVNLKSHLSSYHFQILGLSQHNSLGLSFIDSSALSLDIVASTYATQWQFVNLDSISTAAFFVSLLWCFVGSLHILLLHPAPLLDMDNLNGKNIQSIIKHPATSQIVVIICILGLVLSTYTFPSQKYALKDNQEGYYAHSSFEDLSIIDLSSLPLFLRSICYLSICILDAYFLRNPGQREKDRIYMFRYGFILFAPFFDGTLMILICCTLGIVCFKIHQVCLSSNASQCNYLGNSLHKESHKEKEEETRKKSPDRQNGATSSYAHSHLLQSNPQLPLIDLFMKQSKQRLLCLSGPSPLQHTGCAAPFVHMPACITHHQSQSTNGGGAIPFATGVSCHKTLDPSSSLMQLNISAQDTQVSNAATRELASHINLDQIDVHEAFKLAKLKYTDTKATV